jgi:hypothetical protein
VRQSDAFAERKSACIIFARHHDSRSALKVVWQGLGEQVYCVLCPTIHSSSAKELGISADENQHCLPTIM